LVRILAIIGGVVIMLAIGLIVFLKVKAPHFLHFSKNIEEVHIEVHLDSLAGAEFIQGMNGCENRALSPFGTDFYVSCLDGQIYHLSRRGSGRFSVNQSFKPGNQALGMAIGSDSLLYVNLGQGKPEEWMTRGGGVFRMKPGTNDFERLTEDYQAVNGLASDSRGDIYFTSSNFNFFRPEGRIYQVKHLADGGFSPPVLLLEDAGVSNGLYYSPAEDKFYYSNTLGGVYSFLPGDTNLREEYLKLRFLEACDDLCTDISGNIWMSDPGYSTLKMYNPGTNRLVRFVIQGIGQTSSVRTRTEEGMEMLYITELKKEQKPMKQEWDGRGVLVVPARSLIGLLKTGHEVILR
jgi:hypothetical protein